MPRRKVIERSQGPDVIPCRQELVNMGGSYSGPPEVWRTVTRTCVRCKALFTVTAEEQRFWYEDLRIFYWVAIDRCLPCRRRARAQRRVIAQLGALLPEVARGSASVAERREAVLAITIASRMTMDKTGEAIVHRPATIAQGLAIAAGLRRLSSHHDDLVVAQIALREHLGEGAPLARLRAKREEIVASGKSAARAVRDLERWLETPTPELWQRIIERR